MKNIIRMLKGQSFEQGKGTIKNEFGSLINESYVDGDSTDIYVYKENNENWVCFTCPMGDKVYADDITRELFLDKGYWSVNIDGEVTTELEIQNHGGSRDGSGRKATGAKPNRTFRLDDDEFMQVKNFIKQLRS